MGNFTRIQDFKWVFVGLTDSAENEKDDCVDEDGPKPDILIESNVNFITTFVDKDSDYWKLLGEKKFDSFAEQQFDNIFNKIESNCPGAIISCCDVYPFQQTDLLNPDQVDHSKIVVEFPNDQAADCAYDVIIKIINDSMTEYEAYLSNQVMFKF